MVVWDTKDIEMMDIEGTSDVFIRTSLGNASKETDTHYRCKDGVASFNYRILFNVMAPTLKDHEYTVSVQAWDRDFFASNDLIGEAQIDLKAMFDDVIETGGRSFQVTKKYYEQYLKDVMGKGQPLLDFEDEDSFWLPLKGKDEKTGEMRVQGFVRLSIVVLSKTE